MWLQFYEHLKSAPSWKRGRSCRSQGYKDALKVCWMLNHVFWISFKFSDHFWTFFSYVGLIRFNESLMLFHMWHVLSFWILGHSNSTSLPKKLSWDCFHCDVMNFMDLIGRCSFLLLRDERHVQQDGAFSLARFIHPSSLHLGHPLWQWRWRFLLHFLLLTLTLTLPHMYEQVEGRHLNSASC